MFIKNCNFKFGGKKWNAANCGRLMGSGKRMIFFFHQMHSMVVEEVGDVVWCIFRSWNKGGGGRLHIWVYHGRRQWTGPVIGGRTAELNGEEDLGTAGGG